MYWGKDMLLFTKALFLYQLQLILEIWIAKSSCICIMRLLNISYVMYYCVRGIKTIGKIQHNTENIDETI